VSCQASLITLHYIMSSNSTPSSRSYSDLVDTWADPVCIHQVVLRPRSMAACVIAGS